ncbi:hypothetical protein DFH08DRAFT_968959 [Mycena albidolilacea]|uniref:Uncharacterized protein n=1 Tax=Mycena albidolilacea TaxID=1033008 RepID=A0AAD6ZIF1_9AGAR|nr:hypothetical protein DFH08DRAFT_968959 [Mycena albidolilacea]
MSSMPKSFTTKYCLVTTSSLLQLAAGTITLALYSVDGSWTYHPFYLLLIYQ